MYFSKQRGRFLGIVPPRAPPLSQIEWSVVSQVAIFSAPRVAMRRRKGGGEMWVGGGEGDACILLQKREPSSCSSYPMVVVFQFVPFMNF